MSDDANEEKRRARLRAMQERYQQQAPTDFAVTAPAANESVAERRPVSRNRHGRLQREARQPQAMQPAGGGLLQRLLQFLQEVSPGDTPIAGMAIGERRLQQAVHWLEQRAQASQGGANERVQRLLRFLTQEIPGEPMVAGVNLKRLQQLLERAEGASGADTLVSKASSSETAPVVRAADVAAVADEVVAVLPQAVALETVVTSTSEIAVLEETLQRLREISQDLERRLDAARHGGGIAADSEGGMNQPTASASLQRASDESLPNLKPSPSAARVPRPEAGDWFTEFLE